MALIALTQLNTCAWSPPRQSPTQSQSTGSQPHLLMREMAIVNLDLQLYVVHSFRRFLASTEQPHCLIYLQ
jgi:hypothetical protein